MIMGKGKKNDDAGEGAENCWLRQCPQRGERGWGNWHRWRGPVLEGGEDCSSIEMGEEAEDVGTDARGWQD